MGLMTELCGIQKQKQYWLIENIYLSYGLKNL